MYTRSPCVYTLHIGLSDDVCLYQTFLFVIYSIYFVLILAVDKRIQDSIPPTIQNVCGVLDPRKYFVVKQIGCGSCGKVQNVQCIIIVWRHYSLSLCFCFSQVYFCQTKDRLQNYAVKQVDLGVNGRETQQVKRLKNVSIENEIL